MVGVTGEEAEDVCVAVFGFASIGSWSAAGLSVGKETSTAAGDVGEALTGAEGGIK